MRAYLTLAVAAVVSSPGWAQPARPSLEYSVSTAMLFESNLDHDETPKDAFGGVLGMGLGFRDRAVQPRLELRYQVAGHRYSIPAQWNRVSQAGAATFTARPTGRLTLRSGVEMSLKGSSDDRDLGDQYQAAQRIAWRVLRRTTLEVTAVGRLRRYELDSTRNARNGYLEAGLTQRLTPALALTAGARLESNTANAARNSYDRISYQAELGIETGGSDLELDLEYKIKRYRSRPVDDGPDEGLQRRDRRLEAQIAWTVRPWRSLDLTLGYQFERRHSNELGKAYVAHQSGLTITRRW